MKAFLTLFFLVSLLIIPRIDAVAQDWAKEKLDKSPRHLEWVNVKHGDHVLKCFIAYPEVKTKATAIVVIHEIFGLSDWVREQCDELAAEGFIAIAPDLLSGKEGEETAKYKQDELRKLVSSLPPEQITEDLLATHDYVAKLPAANGKVAVAGFCWGGTQTWKAVTTDPKYKAGCVFYGTADSASSALANIKTPVYGFYGERDARVTSTVEDTKKKMHEAHKIFQPVIYPNTGHAFMRTGEAPDAEQGNKEARTEAWSRLIKVLHKI